MDGALARETRHLQCINTAENIKLIQCKFFKICHERLLFKSCQHKNKIVHMA